MNPEITFIESPINWSGYEMQLTIPSDHDVDNVRFIINCDSGQWSIGNLRQLAELCMEAWNYSSSYTFARVYFNNTDIIVMYEVDE